MNRRSVLWTAGAVAAILAWITCQALNIRFATKYFATDLSIEVPSGGISSEDLYAVLNAMPEFSNDPSPCPNAGGSCSAADGLVEIRSSRILSSSQLLAVELSTAEYASFWEPEFSPDRHKAFVERVIYALRDSGYIVEVVNQALAPVD